MAEELRGLKMVSKEKREEIAQFLFYFKNPTMQGESGADASCNPNWSGIPELERESYRKATKGFLSRIFAEDQTVELLR